MALKPLNSVAGFSVGGSPTNVISSIGDFFASNLTVNGTSNLNSIGNIYISGGTAGQVINTDGAGNLSFVTISTSGLSNGNSNIQVLANSNITLSSTGNANIVVITGTGANVTGYLTVAGNITANGNLSANNYLVTPGSQDLIVAPGSTLTRFYSNVNPYSDSTYELGNGLARWNNIYTKEANVSGNANIGTVRTDNLLYANGTAWDFATAAGLNTQVQFSNGTDLAASANFTFDAATNLLTVTGNGQFNNANLGNLAVANSFNTNGAGGNITLTGGNIIGANAVIANTFTSNVATGTAPLSVQSTTRVANLNVAQANVSDYVTVTTQTTGTFYPILAGGNTTGNYSQGSNSNLSFNAATGNLSTTLLNVTSNANVGNLGFGSGEITGTGNVTGGNIVGTIAAGSNSITTTGNANVGNLAAAQVLASSNITAPQIISNVATGTSPLVVTSTTRVSNLNVNYANVADFGVVTTQSTGIYYPTFVNANTTGNYAQASNTLISANLANGALIATTFVGNITGNIGGSLANGTSNVSIPLVNGNIDLTAAGNTTLVVTGTGANISGTLYANGNANVGNLVTGTANATNLNASNIVSLGGLVDFNTNNANVQLGSNANVHLYGGSNGQALITDGAGNLSWTTVSSSNIRNGNSNVTITDPNGNVYINANAGTDRQWNFDTTGNTTFPAIGVANLGNLVTANYANFANDLVVQGNIANANNINATNKITSDTANIIGNLTSGNANLGNLVIANYANFANDVAVGGNIVTGTGSGGNISGVDYLFANVLTLTGNLSAGNANISGDFNANGNGTFGNLSATSNISGGNANITGALSVTGNGTFGNLSVTSNISGGNANITGTLSVTGNSTVSNLIVSNSIFGSNLIIYSTGSLTLAPTGNINANASYINNVLNPVQAQDVATKIYVDNAVSTGLVIHPSVVDESVNNLDSSYASGGTTPTWTTITSNSIIDTGSAHGLSINNVIVFGSTTNGVTAGTPYFVSSVPTSTSITISLAFNGSTIVTLVNGTGLSITSLANSGVGATLTSDTNGPLVLGTYTCQINDRILLLGQTIQTENGVYYISQVGVIDPAGSPWILTRATDANQYIPNSAAGLSQGGYFLVTGGDNAGNAYVCNTIGIIVFATTNITFAQFSTVQEYSAGTGLGLYANNQFYIANTLVTAGSYGNGDSVPSYTVNQQGQLTAAANVAITANAANLTGTALASTIVTSNLTSVGTLSALTVNGNVQLGNVENVHIDGGTLNYLLTTDGLGNLSWTSPGSTLANGNSNVSIPIASGNVYISANAGTDRQWIFDTTGNATFPTTGVVNLGATAIANKINVGSLTSILFGNTTTTSISANQTISSLNVATITGVEYLVKGIDSGGKYSVATVLAVTDGANVDYTIFGSIQLGGATGTLAVNIVGGFVRLQVTPSSSNSTIWVTQARII